MSIHRETLMAFTVGYFTVNSKDRLVNIRNLILILGLAMRKRSGEAI